MSSPVPIRPVKAAATLAAVLALSAAAVIPADAAEPPPGTARSAVPAKSAKVTLITGDVVEISDAGNGKKAASVQPAAGREGVSFHTLEVDGGLRVLPSDAVPYISTGVLDADLFDVDELIADGFGDAAAPTLPLIVRYSDPSAARTQSLAGTTSSRALDSIGGAAISAAKNELPALWKSLEPNPNARALSRGIAKIWLDGKVRPVLDRSVPQIGAPAAWQAGYEGAGVEVAVLDTGVDAEHPDLKGKVQQALDFSGSETGSADHFGHGTHVAATIAGTGAGSNGTHKGVAPKADLLVGKVLGDDGMGFESWIIAGMEWAAAEGAKVVNMSLGGGPTDGTDPLSQAVDQITAASGTLFVVAAGNDGQDESVGTPGAAAAALTVGAVDRNDVLADFSSRGPRVGDSGLKPEISAPGVGIVAARATGTAMGEPLNDLYTSASGTSMATPHVAGAAALLAQAHPDWKADRLKNALVSTAKTAPDVSVYAQGSGRVDVARAVAQKVYASAVADFGFVTAGVTKTVTYKNDTTAPVTLALSVDVDNLDAHKPETDALSLPSSVTVPAGGSVDVPVTLDPAKLDRGLHSGWIVATGPNGVVTHTAVGTLKAGPKHSVKLRAVGLDGRPTGVPVISLFGDNSRSDLLAWIPDGEGFTAEVEEGTYLLHSLVENSNPQDEKVSLYTDPNILVTKDIEIVIDARKAVPIKITTPKPSEQQAVLSYYVHREYGNGRKISHGVMHFSTVQQVLVTPTKPVAEGSFEFSSRWQLAAPLVQASVQGVTGPLDINILHRSPSFEGKKRFPLVAAGPDLQGVKGAVAVIHSSEDGWGNGSEQDQIAAAAKAGAAGVILVRPADWSAWTVWTPIGEREPIPAMVTTAKVGQKLVDRARLGRATIDLTLTTSSPYLYDVQQVSAGSIPAQIDYKVTTANSARVNSSYSDNGGFNWAKEQRFGWRPWQDYAWNDAQRVVQTPKVREEWVTAGDSLWQHRVHHLYTWNEMGPLLGGLTSLPRSYQAGTSNETWFGPVVRPAAAPGVASTRTGDRLSLRIPAFVDDAGHFTVQETTSASAVLSRNGAVVAELPNAWQDVTTSGGDAAYKLELSTERKDTEGEWNWGTSTRTVWDFRSNTASADKAAALPLLQVGYDVPVDLYGRVAPKPHLVGFTVQQQAGAPAARSTSLQAEVSFDEGKSWRQIVAVGARGRYVAVVPAGNGSVSLRVVAGDGLGNKVSQTMIKAYGLK
ncbi:S8 family serine peptidase [Kribbella sancticallisti]|uniref:S8 family serine peptidase n=1 Tax=Kribbella sancticallisti TaxID=460087 RepID=A0ABP4NPU3_9ACTN